MYIIDQFSPLKCVKLGVISFILLSRFLSGYLISYLDITFKINNITQFLTLFTKKLTSDFQN